MDGSGHADEPTEREAEPRAEARGEQSEGEEPGAKVKGERSSEPSRPREIEAIGGR